MTMLVLTATTHRRSEQAKRRLLATEGGAFLLNDWMRAVFMHYRVPPRVLQRHVPYKLDLREGHAYISLVAFEMLKLRLHTGGRWLRWVTAPVNNHGFLNVRTYVHYHGEPGIYFLAEFLPNRLATFLGPRTFGLPYRYGKLDYQHALRGAAHGRAMGDVLGGLVRQPNTSATMRWRAHVPAGAAFAPCAADSLDEFLLERYTCFTKWRTVRRLFRVWHEPWPQTAIELTLLDTSLLASTGDWLAHAEYAGAHYSPGVTDVWLGKPQCVNGRYCNRRWNESRGTIE